MKKWLLLLNIAFIVLCALVPVGLISYEIMMLTFLIISILNVCCVDSKKKFILYNSIIYVCSIAGIVLDYFEHKSYGVGFHPELAADYHRLIAFCACCGMLVVVIEFMLRHFSDKRSRKA